MTQQLGKPFLGLLQAPTLRAASKEEVSALGTQSRPALPLHGAGHGGDSHHGSAEPAKRGVYEGSTGSSLTHEARQTIASKAD